jgi:hypothetical protein
MFHFIMLLAQREHVKRQDLRHKDKVGSFETRNWCVPKIDRFPKFSCWSPLSFVARLLQTTKLLMFPSQKSDQPVEKPFLGYDYGSAKK